MISATGDALLLCCNRSWTQFAVVLKLGPWSSRGLQSSFTETVKGLLSPTTHQRFCSPFANRLHTPSFLARAARLRTKVKFTRCLPDSFTRCCLCIYSSGAQPFSARSHFMTF